MNREEFIKKSILGIAGLSTMNIFNRYPSQSEALDPGLVKEFVLAGHGELDKVKDMLSTEPNLIYARHDWGGGDFEEAIEGAGHVGERAIAKYLIEKGARVNLFVLTMLGRTKLVIPLLEAYPSLIQAKGPHGFTLLHHAKVGGKNAEPLYHYLMENGLTTSRIDF